MRVWPPKLKEPKFQTWFSAAQICAGHAVFCRDIFFSARGETKAVGFQPRAVRLHACGPPRGGGPGQSRNRLNSRGGEWGGGSTPHLGGVSPLSLPPGDGFHAALPATHPLVPWACPGSSQSWLAFLTLGFVTLAATVLCAPRPQFPGLMLSPGGGEELSGELFEELVNWYCWLSPRQLIPIRIHFVFTQQAVLWLNLVAAVRLS